jgi:2-polyprenyl-6-methoxyphenol hydroxylase-like FAD-dependent oxidoreductase
MSGLEHGNPLRAIDHDNNLLTSRERKATGPAGLLPKIYCLDIFPMRAPGDASSGAFHFRITLFLFVFATGNDALPETLDGQKELLLALYADDQWECGHILDELKGTQEIYFDRASQIRMPSWSQGRVALVGDAAFCVSLLAGQGSALAMTSAYVLAGELAKAGGRHELAFREYEAFLRSYIETKQRQRPNGAFGFAIR